MADNYKVQPAEDGRPIHICLSIRLSSAMAGYGPQPGALRTHSVDPRTRHIDHKLAVRGIELDDGAHFALLIG